MRFRRTSKRRGPINPGKADLHIHSHFSDGFHSIPDILEWVARETDLHVIAITDHDTIEGAWLAQALARQRGYPFEVIAGVEVSTLDGHLLVLFATKPIPAGLPMEETVALAHAQDALCILPHPFSRSGLMGFSERYRQSPELAYELEVDGIETFNGAMLTSPCNRLSEQLAQQLERPALAGSDAHVQQAIGFSRTHFPGRTAADLRAAISAGTVAPAGRYWSYFAFFMTGLKWTWQGLPWPRGGAGFFRPGQRVEIN